RPRALEALLIVNLSRLHANPANALDPRADRDSVRALPESVCLLLAHERVVCCAPFGFGDDLGDGVFDSACPGAGDNAPPQFARVASRGFRAVPCLGGSPPPKSTRESRSIATLSMGRMADRGGDRQRQSD